MKYGMCQVMEALLHCHKNAKIIHGNLTPQNIYMTPKGHWKISGFHFSVAGNEFVSIPKQISTNHFLPSLDYLAPEYALENNPVTESDIFSMSMVYAQLLVNQYQRKVLKLSTSNNSIINAGLSKDAYINQVGQLSKLIEEKLTFLHDETTSASSIIESVKRGTIKNPKERTDSSFILNNCELMFGEEVKALRFLSNMEVREPVKKATFLQSLLPMLKQKRIPQAASATPAVDESQASDEDYLFPIRIVLQKILPALLKECRDAKMCIFALPNVLALSTRLSQQQFSQLVLPTVHKHCMILPPEQTGRANTQPTSTINPKIPLMVLRHLHILWSKTTNSEQRNFIIPFLVQALKYHSNADIQVEAMKRSEEALNAQLIDAQTFKNEFLPSIKDTCERTNSEAVRTNAVVCVGKALDGLDYPTMVNHALPLVENALVKNPRNASSVLLMSCVGVLRKMTKLLMNPPNQTASLGNPQFLHVVASRILPSVMPVATQKSLSQAQFKKYIKAVKSMMDMVEHCRMQEYEESRQFQSPLLSHSDLTDISEDDDPTIADVLTEDPFNPPSASSSMISSKASQRMPSMHELPKTPSIRNLPPIVTQPVQQPVQPVKPVQPVQPVQPVAQTTNQKQPVASQPSQPKLNVDPNNPLHKLLNDAPGPTKSQNVFFDEEEDAGTHDDESTSENKEQELERLAMLMDRAEEHHQFDQLLGNYMGDKNHPMLESMSLGMGDDDFYGENNNNAPSSPFEMNYESTIAPVDEEEDHYHQQQQQQQQSVPQQQQQISQPPQNNVTTQEDDSFDRLLNNYGDSNNYSSGLGAYGNNNNYEDTGSNPLYSWNTPSNNNNDQEETKPARSLSGAALDFDSLLGRHIDDDF
jgi:SCY1-like protein 2